jgi:outer membrane protein OmpA-like peptidoglycan-associated protein
MSNHSYANRVLFIAILTILFFASGCAKKTTVVLLPDPDGKVGHVTVTSDITTVDLDQANEATVVAGRNKMPTEPRIMKQEKIDADFGVVLAVLPEKPTHFLLYFETGSTKLTSDSQKTLSDITQTINANDSQDISVIGHADRAGNRDYNMTLSTKRATEVVRLLVQQGVKPEYVKATSHGEENPLIKTADNVQSPKNRRVEVVVR